MEETAGAFRGNVMEEFIVLRRAARSGVQIAF